MIELIPSTPRDITIVAANMREWDRREFEASAAYASLTQAALLCHHCSPQKGIALEYGQPIAAFGAFASPLHPHIRIAWAFGTDRFKRAVPAISAEVNAWKPLLMAEGVHRIEARLLSGHDIAARWLRALGARQEGLLRKAGRGGEDFELWAWVPEN